MTERYIKLVNGIEVDMTAEEIAQRQTEENAPPPPLPLADQLNQIFSELQPEQQADLSPLKAAIKLELEQNRLEIARLIIQRATIPIELENVRQDMLARFPAQEPS